MLTKFVGFLSKPIQPSLLKHGYHKHIEQFRGLCALLVLINHATVHEDLLLNNFKWPEPVHYFGAGYLSVMVFFCISGYVIGITNDKKQFNIKSYIKRRLVRLYPAYIISILICLIVAGGVSLIVLAENLLFLQNSAPYWHFAVPIFGGNAVTWSLNYEVLYYIVFIALFFMRPRVWQLSLCMLVLSILLVNSNEKIMFFTDYLNGFYFWILGLFIAWKIIDGDDKNVSVPLLSMLFLHLCQHHLGLGVIILHTFGIYANSNFNWIFDIPFCLMIMSILTQKDSLFLRINKIVCYIIPGIVFGYLTLHGRLFEDDRWIMCLIFWALSLLFYSEKRFSAVILNKLTFIGKISYALYLVHIPIASLIKKTIFINSQPIEIVVKYVLWICITFSLAILVDLVFQPAIKKYFIHS